MVLMAVMMTMMMMLMMLLVVVVWMMAEGRTGLCRTVSSAGERENERPVISSVRTDGWMEIDE